MTGFITRELFLVALAVSRGSPAFCACCVFSLTYTRVDVFDLRRYLIDTEVPDTDNDMLETVFFAICLASTFFGLLSILVMGLGCNHLVSCRKCCGISANNWVALLEVAFEDIPQVVITVLVSYRIRGPLSSQAVFNLTTSGMNFMLDILDIADEFADDRAERAEMDQETGGYQATTY